MPIKRLWHLKTFPNPPGYMYVCKSDLSLFIQLNKSHAQELVGDDYNFKISRRRNASNVSLVAHAYTA